MSLSTLPAPYRKLENPEKISLSTALKSEIDHWLSKYPTEHRQSALGPALLIAQRTHGWLPLAMIDAVADYIQVPRAIAYEVATFYSMLELKPVGAYKISVCTNISCMLNGSDGIVESLIQRLKIRFGETSSDKQFTLKEVECLGACVKAPVILINDTYYEALTTEKVNTLLDALNTPEKPEIS